MHITESSRKTDSFAQIDLFGGEGGIRTHVSAADSCDEVYDTSLKGMAGAAAPAAAGRVRIRTNKVVAGVCVSTLLLKIRLQDARQFTSEQVFNQLEGLALARAWGFESPLPHQPSLPARDASLLRLASQRAHRRLSAAAASA